MKGKPNKQTNSNYRGSVLGDNPTYVSDVPQMVTGMNPRTAQLGQVQRSRSNRSRTTSHKYDYIVSVQGVNEATQSPNELAEMESGTYSYIDERTVRRLLSSEPTPSQRNSCMPSAILHTSAAIDIFLAHYETVENNSEPQAQPMSADISAHYETMDNSKPQAQPVSADISAHYEASEPQAQQVSADISAHYETMDNSKPQAQPVSADISAHYETMDNSEPQAQPVSADISAHYETMDNSEPQAQPVSADISAHYETMDNSEPQAQPLSADISAHYETMENCVLSDTESCDSITA